MGATGSPVSVGDTASNGLAAHDPDRSSSVEASSARAFPATTDPPAPAPALDVAPAVSKAVEDVLYSDIGINTLLGRLKQSIASARELAGFMSGLAKAEENLSKEYSRNAQALIGQIQRGESRHGSYSRQLEQVANLYKQRSTADMKFVYSMNTMSQDLLNLAGEKDKERRHLKQQGMSAEDKARDAERQLDRAKSKYDSLATEYDLVKTGDKTAGRHFGIRSMGKSSDQREEELQRKVKNADDDYQAKVQQAQQIRNELVTTTRPEVVGALQSLIQEIDGAVTMQLQKLAGITEQNIVRNGMLVNPIPDLQPGQRGFRQIVAEIDNELDFRNYLVSHSSKIPARPAEIKYQSHPSLKPLGQQPPAFQARPQQSIQQPPPQQAPPQFPMAPPAQQQPLNQQPPAQQPPAQQPPAQQPPPSLPPPSFQRFDGGFGQQPPTPISQQPTQHAPYPDERGFGPQQPFYPQQPPPGASGAPYGAIPYVGPATDLRGPQPQTQRPPTGDKAMGGPVGAPAHRMFGLTLDELFNRDRSPVPIIIIQCVQAVDMFGLEAEGIYRVSGNQSQIQQLKVRFDQDAYSVDFRHPEEFFHDVHVPANLLKLFLRELPDPLLTKERYDDFMSAARIEDDTVRRDSLHAIINELPDPNYATLRAIVLHLHRVNENSHANRMTPQNLAVIFGPTLMGQHTGDMTLAGLQPKVIATILQNALQIFDED